MNPAWLEEDLVSRVSTDENGDEIIHIGMLEGVPMYHRTRDGYRYGRSDDGRRSIVLDDEGGYYLIEREPTA